MIIKDDRPSIFDRLYSSSERKITEGKERRLEIEKSLASKNKPHEFPDKKISLSQAEEFYNKSVKYAMEKDGKLAAVAMERDRTFEAQFNFNEDLQQKVGAMSLDEFIHRICDSPSDSGTDTDESEDHDRNKISLSQATEFYHRAVKYAKEKDDRLAAMAFERDRSYKTRFNFKKDLTGGEHEQDNVRRLSTVLDESDNSDTSERKISVDQADEFYYKAIMRAVEKEERLAAEALERDRSYHAQFNFNSDSLREK